MTEADHRGWLLAIDTATSRVIVAAGTSAGELIAVRTFAAGHRHGSHLLPTIEALTREERLPLDRVAGVIVGLGPGAFTGLRVGLATAKTMAHALGLPIAGVSTGEALLAAARPDAEEDGLGDTLLLPAGPHDRVVVESGKAPRLEAGDGGAERRAVIAVDLEGRASPEALQRGHLAVARLPAALLWLGAERLRSAEADDVERLVPAYVSLPRGITTELGQGGVAWSRDPR